MKKLKRLLLNMVLASLMMGFSVEGEGTAETDTTAGSGDQTATGDGGDTTDAAATAEATEAARVAALSPEAKAAEAAAAAQKLEAAKLVGAPEKYAAFTAPEGTTLAEGMEPALADLGKKFNLSQEGIQALLNTFAKDIQPLMQADREKAWQGVREGWKEQVKADPELGGTKYDETVAVATRAINTYMTDDIKSVLAEYGLGDHPGMVRLMYKIGTTIREDTFVTPGGGNTPESKLAGLYPTMKQ